MPPLTPTALIQRIEQRDTPLYDRLYRTARYIRHVNVPCIRAIHLPLYWLHRVLTGAFFHTLRLLFIAVSALAVTGWGRGCSSSEVCRWSKDIFAFV